MEHGKDCIKIKELTVARLLAAEDFSEEVENKFKFTRNTQSAKNIAQIASDLWNATLAGDTDWESYFENSRLFIEKLPYKKRWELFETSSLSEPNSGFRLILPRSADLLDEGVYEAFTAKALNKNGAYYKKGDDVGNVPLYFIKDEDVETERFIVLILNREAYLM